MDSLTHIFLGGAIAPAVFGKRAGWAGVIVGALAATLPDLDVFVRTGDSILDHALHRSCTHSLIMVPVLGFAAAFPFAAMRRFNKLWKKLAIIGMLAVLSHVLLDACTSYGTQMLWPFSSRRFAGDWIAVIDPAFSLPLLAGLVVSLRQKSARGARVALAFAAVYMAVAVVQHARAMGVQREILAQRGQTAEQGRVLPVVGTINGYRSVYMAGGVLYADAIRVPFYSPGMVREGEQVNVLEPGTAGKDGESQRELQIFEKFADGYVARMPGRPEVIGDMRYSLVSDKFQAPWGVQLEPPPAKWVTFAEWSKRNWRAIWREMVGAGKWEEVREVKRIQS